jgi:hypothetical protein
MKYIRYLSACLLAACSSKLTPTPIGLSISGPVAVTPHRTSSHFYVLNSNASKTFDDGSILTLDTSGNKVNAVSTPRIGLFLITAESGDFIISGFAEDLENKSASQIHLYDTSNPTAPSLVKTFALDCVPANATERDSYIAVSCLSGSIYVGKLNGVNSTLTKVRPSDGTTRRALYIDSPRKLLYAFPTDMAEPTYSDRKLVDKMTYGSDFTALPTPNEIPDEFEKSRTAVSFNTGVNSSFKFLVYDLAQEEANGFPEKTIKDLSISQELRYIYFDVLKSGHAAPAADEKYYRTNFWTARPDPQDPNSFYLSHRGAAENSATQDASGILKVSVIGDPKVQNGVMPKIPEFFKFEGFYGYHPASSELAYPNDFQFLLLNSTPLLIFNDYRDIVYNKENYFRLGTASKFGAQSVEPLGNQKIENTSPSDALIGIAVNSAGKGMSLSFFSDEVILLDITNSGDITETKRIK